VANEMTAVVRSMFDALGAGDAEAVMRLAADDMQGVDEISRRWLRGSTEVGEYIGQLVGAVQDVDSQMLDPHERQWGDCGVVTFWLEQTYTYEGQAAQVSAPTSVVLRKADDQWKVALFHSIPLPASEG
jgi:uncharacterized protein (TIGR02246 family)